MRLNGLHRLSTTNLPGPIHEELGAIDPNLDYLRKMIQNQGKDPDTIINQVQMRIRGSGLREWIRAAKPGESKEGRDPTTGRKIRIAVLDSIQKVPLHVKTTKLTVAEAVIRDLISEGGYNSIGKAILDKLNDLVDEPSEPKHINRAEEKYPMLSRLMRYAQSAEEDIKNDEFWALVDKITDGKGEEIKKLTDHIHCCQDEAREKGGITVIESTISSVMKSLGLNEEDVANIMQSNNLQDKEYDLSKLSQNAKSQDAKEPPIEPETKAKKNQNKIKRDNNEYVQSVILAAEWVLDAVAAGATEKAIDQAVADPTIVSDEDLAPDDDGTNAFSQDAAEYEAHGSQPSGHF